MRCQLQTLYKFDAVMTFLVILTALFLCGNAAHADTGTSARTLQLALAAPQSASLYEGHGADSPFAISSSFFSGRASGRDAASVGLSSLSFDDRLDRTAELEGDQRVYALLIDGTYDFNYDVESTGLRPYVAGGVGMAVYSRPGASASLASGSNVVPLFRVGGGVTYRLDQKWDLSLDYRAGFSGASAGDQVFTGRGQQTVDLQMLNMGMRYQF